MKKLLLLFIILISGCSKENNPIEEAGKIGSGACGGLHTLNRIDCKRGECCHVQRLTEN
jgi:hypothetical protein